MQKKNEYMYDSRKWYHNYMLRSKKEIRKNFRDLKFYFATLLLIYIYKFKIKIFSILFFLPIFLFCS